MLRREDLGSGGSTAASRTANSALGSRSILGLGLSVGIAVLAAVALASTGSLTYRGCIANRGGHGCLRPAHNSLAGATAVAASPDGNSVYVSSYFANSLTIFGRGADGSLSYRRCIADGRQNGCARPAHGSLYGTEALAVNPDGRSVYVVSDENTVTSFHRAPDGWLRFQSCVGGRDYGCKELRHNPIGGPQAIAVSPDGTSVYVVSFDSESITAFRRRADGSLAFNGCIADRYASRHCTSARHDSLIGAYSVAVSPDGRSVYVGSGNAVTSFRRAADGSLTYAGCIANGGFDGCVAPHRSLGTPWAIAASPDGRSVYAISLGDRVTSFTRTSGGRLAYQRCITDHRSSVCAEAPEGSLLGTGSITVSPDGKSVLVGGLTTVASFRRRADGSLRYQDCVANSGRDRPPGCAPIGNHSLQSVRGLAVSPDGSSAYATSFDGNAIDTIAVDPPGPAPQQRNGSGGG